MKAPDTQQNEAPWMKLLKSSCPGEVSLDLKTHDFQRDLFTPFTHPIYHDGTDTELP